MLAVLYCFTNGDYPDLNRKHQPGGNLVLHLSLVTYFLAQKREIRVPQLPDLFSFPAFLCSSGIGAVC